MATNLSWAEELFLEGRGKGDLVMEFEFFVAVLRGGMAWKYGATRI